MWCHVRMLNPTNNNPQRVKKVDKEIAKSLDYSNIKFPIKEKDKKKKKKEKKQHQFKCILLQ